MMSLTFGLFTQVSGSGPLGPLVLEWLRGEIMSNNRINTSISFQNNSKNLDPSYKMDLDLWACLGRV